MTVLGRVRDLIQVEVEGMYVKREKYNKKYLGSVTVICPVRTNNK